MLLSSYVELRGEKGDKKGKNQKKGKEVRKGGGLHSTGHSNLGHQREKRMYLNIFFSSIMHTKLL